DLAELRGETRSLEGATGEPTARYEPPPVAGVRLRGRSVIVGGAAVDSQDRKFHIHGIMDGVAPTLPARGTAGQHPDAPGPDVDLEDASRDRPQRGAMPNSGDILGKYRLGKKLGEGAFGLVFAARDTGLDRDVALKFLRSHHVSNPQVLERF